MQLARGTEILIRFNHAILCRWRKNAEDKIQSDFVVLTLAATRAQSLIQIDKPIGSIIFRCVLVSL